VKKNIFLTLLSGLLFALSWPTYGFPLLIFFAFIPLLFIEQDYYENKHKKHFFLYIYLAFFVWNSITTWWVWNSTPFGGVFAIVVNSFLMGLTFWLFHFVRKRVPDRMAYVFFPVMWLSFEKFHLNWDFSWPWLNLGNVFSEHTALVQWYEYTGFFGGGLWILTVNVLLFFSLGKYFKIKQKKLLYQAFIKAIFWMGVPIIFSLILFRQYEEKGNAAKVLLLQPNLDPWKEKFKYNNKELAEDLLQLAENKNDFELLMAPETAISRSTDLPYFVNTEAYNILHDYALMHSKTAILTGVDFVQWYRNQDKVPESANQYKNRKIWYDLYNSAVLIDASKDFKVYHKSKLVVGAEYTPFRKVLKPILGDIMISLGGSMGTHVKQEKRTVFKVAYSDIKVAPIICYESIYGEYVTDYVKNGANLLGIITNDGWWGKTQGYKQHLSYARLRAVENRRDVLQAANTGISAHIDQKGEIIDFLDYEIRGSLSANVRLNETKTFYSKHGDYIARVSVFLAVLLFLYSFARKRLRL